MKRGAAFLLSALMSVGLLSGCGGQIEASSSMEEPKEITGTMEQLRVLLPYHVNHGLAEQKKDQFALSLQQALERQGWAVDQVTVDVAPTATSSGKALDDGTADVVILPASQYLTYNEDAKLLMTATRPGLNVKSTDPQDWNGSVDSVAYTAEDCPYSRTLICATKSEKGQKLASEAKNGTLTWEMLQDATWMYPRAQTSSDFFYPDLWLTKKFDKTMLDLPHTIPIEGYGALFAEAGRGDADVIVIEADKRIDYAEAWKLSSEALDYTGKRGLGHEDSIFNEIQVLGVTEPIYGDVMVLRTEEEALRNVDFQYALIEAMDALENDDITREIWDSCGYTGFTSSNDTYYENIHDVPVFDAGE